MATYKKFCIYCSGLILGDSNICPLCGRESPFYLKCPICSSSIEKGWKICSNCGNKLNIICPFCKKESFASKTCDNCGGELVVKCSNKKCSHVQVITSDLKCKKCGKQLK